MADNYFHSTKNGELFELKSDLNSGKKEKQKKAIRKIILSMTAGKDVSALFSDVVNCIQTDNWEQKKLVFLYLTKYGKFNPEMSIMAVNTLLKDCEDENPLLRAAALRTMASIKVDGIIEYLCEPLRKCLQDKDPYVRKTAAVSVAKLYNMNAQLVVDQGFLEQLKELLSDSYPMVVSNTVAALSEINEANITDSPLIEMNPRLIKKLLIVLDKCSEFGQIYILDLLASYNTNNDLEAQSICKRITPQLAHANSGIVLSTVKVLMKLTEIIIDSDFVTTLNNKLAPPLVTLLSTDPEIEYVALRNINLIVQKRPDIFKHEMKVFFVKYNDPIYIKLEKLDIMIRLTSQENIAQVLSELKEYATEIDIDFVRKAVRAIGRCAIKVEESADRCVSTLLDLVKTKVNYVVQEVIVVIKDIFRKYPNKYESSISLLCENLDMLDEPEARASMIWIIGEYAERIDNADELLKSFLDSFHDENTQVQLLLLTAIIKLFLKCPNNSFDIVQQVLKLATEHSDNPDLRDRGYIYWRLLSTDIKAAKEIVLAKKPLISEETDLLEPTLLDELVCNIPSLASIYHKPQSAFIEERYGLQKSLPVRNENSSTSNTPQVSEFPPLQESLVADLLNLDLTTTNVISPTVNSPNVDLLTSELDLFLNTDLVMPTSNTKLLSDFCGITHIPALYSAPKELWLPCENGKGLEIMGTFSRKGGKIFMDMIFKNKALLPMSDFAIQLNKNVFGLTPAGLFQVINPLLPTKSFEISLPLETTELVQQMEPITNLQVAIKNNIDILYFACIIPMHVSFVENGQMDQELFLSTWKDIPTENQLQFTLKNVSYNTETIISKMLQNNVFTITNKSVEDQTLLYQSLKLINNNWVLNELKIQPGNPNITLLLKSQTMEFADGVFQAYDTILHL